MGVCLCHHEQAFELSVVSLRQTVRYVDMRAMKTGSRLVPGGVKPGRPRDCCWGGNPGPGGCWLGWKVPGGGGPPPICGGRRGDAPMPGAGGRTPKAGTLGPGPGGRAAGIPFAVGGGKPTRTNSHATSSQCSVYSLAGDR